MCIFFLYIEINIFQKKKKIIIIIINVWGYAEILPKPFISILIYFSFFNLSRCKGLFGKISAQPHTLQPSQAKRTPLEYINELIIRNLNPLAISRILLLMKGPINIRIRIWFLIVLKKKSMFKFEGISDGC